MENTSLHQDKELFDRLVHDDSIAFRQLFDKYFQTLYQNAYKLLKSDFWAEEISQETLLHVWETRNTLSDIENPRAWLYRVCSNKCLDKIRRQDIELRAQYLINRESHEMQKEVPAGLHDYTLLRKLLKETIEGLPEQQKLVYLLQQEENLSYKEIATRLEISPHTVRNHLIRAFNTIRNKLISHGEFLPTFVFILFF